MMTEEIIREILVKEVPELPPAELNQLTEMLAEYLVTRKAIDWHPSLKFYELQH